MLEYGSRAISVITTAVGNFSFMSLMDLGTMPGISIYFNFIVRMVKKSSLKKKPKNGKLKSN